MANKSAIPPEHGKFREGQSGNPNGRPKGVPNTSTRLERFLSAVKRGKNPTTGEEEEFTVAELMDLQQIAKYSERSFVAEARQWVTSWPDLNTWAA